MLLHNIYIYIYSFFYSLFSTPLSISAISFSCSFLFSKFSLSSQFFFSLFFSIFSLLCEGLFFCHVGVGVVGHAMGVGVVGYWHHGHAVGVGLCRGVCGFVSWWVIGLMVSWVMPWGFVWWVIGIVVMLWVWWVINFRSCRGCGLLWVLFL